MAVLVLNKQGKPLMPCSEKRARLLLERQRAVVHRQKPFTIRLKHRVDGEVQALRLKLDPGSRFTGIALVREVETGDASTGEVHREAHPLLLAELQHRGASIRDALTQRAAFRRRRRAQLRYRAPRFLNRTRPEGWLAPSLRHRVETAQAWVKRLCRLAQAKAPLCDAAAVNSTRRALYRALVANSLPVETSSGGRTKYNRHRHGLPKAHCLDALCVGQVDVVGRWQRPVLAIKASGRGSYQRTRLTAHGFPRGHLTRQKRHGGFQTGDQVRAMVPTGKKAGIHVGRVAVRKTGSFNIQTPAGVVQGISHRHCTLIQRADGYGYCHQPAIREQESVSR